MLGAEIVIKVLKEQGIKVVFGYPGGSILPVYDKLAGSGIRHILTSHEQYACHAADGYARASGGVGVVFATSGPGATNLVTGIANAYLDSVPLVAITGNVPLSLLGHDAFQEIDIAGVTMPITKHNFIVKEIGDLADTLRDAFRIATSGRKGPVLVDVPTDIFYRKTKYEKCAPLPKTHEELSKKQLDIALEAIEKSAKPFLCAGGGVISADAAPEFAMFARLLQAPTATTAMGKGAFPASDPLSVGLVGMHLSEDARKALSGCDLLIAVGLRFSEKLMENVTAYAPNARILHIDVDAAETGKNTAVYSRVVGDADEALRALLPALSQRKPWCKKASSPACDENDAFSILGRLFPEAVFTTEVGLHQIEAVNRLRMETPRTILTSGGLGAMGFGLPAAIGAYFATGKRVINLSGDGSANMNFMELSTAVRFGVPLIEVIFNNRALGMIEKWQNERFGGRLCQSKTPEIDYPALAAALGAEGTTVCTTQELEKALRDAKRKKSPYVIDYRWESDNT